MRTSKKKQKPRKTFKEKLFSAVFRSWWMFVLCLGFYFFYAQALKRKETAEEELTSRLVELSAQKEGALQEREDLLLQIKSQNDPAWIEMTLMKSLGVVPEGQKKVYFEKDD